MIYIILYNVQKLAYTYIYIHTWYSHVVCHLQPGDRSLSSAPPFRWTRQWSEVALTSASQGSGWESAPRAVQNTGPSLVGGFDPSEKWWSSSDWITIPAIGEVIKFHGSSHHQAVDRVALAEEKSPPSGPMDFWVVLLSHRDLLVSHQNQRVVPVSRTEKFFGNWDSSRGITRRFPNQDGW